jgi:hypothetical protein
MKAACFCVIHRGEFWDETMQTPIKLDFQGMDATQGIRGAVATHVSQLEERFGGATAGRVVLKAPSGHHRAGGLYEINIHLALPEGREVNIGRTPQNDERYPDLDFTLDAAFKRARRQLQDQVRKLQGQVKHHELPIRA